MKKSWKWENHLFVENGHPRGLCPLPQSIISGSLLNATVEFLAALHLVQATFQATLHRMLTDPSKKGMDHQEHKGGHFFRPSCSQGSLSKNTFPSPRNFLALDMKRFRLRPTASLPSPLLLIPSCPTPGPLPDLTGRHVSTNPLADGKSMRP